MLLRGFRLWLLIGTPLLGSCSFFSSAPRANLPVLFHLHDFALTDSTGAAFSSQDLRGKVWIASFLFTRCSEICPTLSAQLKNLGDRLHAQRDFRMVSLTVDPASDSPEVLAQYASTFHADPSRWTFLTGVPDRVHAVLRASFLQPFPDRRALDVAPGYDLLHGARVLLFDKQGRCRGVFPIIRTRENAGSPELVPAIEDLLRE